MRKNVRSFLVEQRSHFALGLGIVVDALGLAALLDDAFDDPLAHGHGHVIDRRILMQRKHIDRLDFFPERILELLGDAHPCHRAAELCFHRRMLERAPAEGLALGADGIQAASRDFFIVPGGGCRSSDL